MNVDCKLKYEKQIELVVLTKDELKDVKDVYVNIGKKYGKCLKQVTETLVTLEHEKQLLIKDVEKLICEKTIHEKYMIEKNDMFEKMKLYDKNIYELNIEILNQNIKRLEEDIINIKLSHEKDIIILKHDMIKIE